MQPTFIDKFWHDLPQKFRTELRSYLRYLANKYQVEEGDSLSIPDKEEDDPNSDLLAPGFLSGKIRLAEDFDAPLEDMRNHM